MVLAKLHGNGWEKVKEGILGHKGEEQVEGKKETAIIIESGGCKTGCRTNRSDCKRNSTPVVY